MSIIRTICLGMACLAALAQTSKPPAADSKAAERGLASFQRHCSACHGQKGEGGRAPDLTRSSLADADLFSAISSGVPGTEMSAYSRRLNPDEIWQVVAFLRSAARGASSPTGDPARGSALFWGKGGCGNCHAVGTRGNRIGPDLTRVGRSRSATYLRESLTSPSTDIPANFTGVTVMTADGKTVRGLERALDDFSVVLQDFSGKIHSFDRADVRSVARDAQSLMPDYSKQFTDAELGDLLAYLSTLRNTGAPQ